MLYKGENRASTPVGHRLAEFLRQTGTALDQGSAEAESDNNNNFFILVRTPEARRPWRLVAPRGLNARQLKRVLNHHWRTVIQHGHVEIEPAECRCCTRLRIRELPHTDAFFAYQQARSEEPLWLPLTPRELAYL